jgi:hypothetical protein
MRLAKTGSHLCLTNWVLSSLTLSARFALADEPLAGSTPAAPRAPHQVQSTNTPPQSPAVFNPDPNALQLPSLPMLDTNWTHTVRLSTNAPPVPAPQFNPDPGAGMPAATNLPAALFVEPTAPAQFQEPVIPPDLALPRQPVRLNEIAPPAPPVPTNYGLEPLTNGLALPREETWRNLKIPPDFGVPGYTLSPGDYPSNSVPVPDRWRLGFTPWKRYTTGVVDQPYDSPTPYLWDPYRQSVLKGDLPVIGQDIFLDLTATAETTTDFSRVPTGSGVSTAVPGEYDFYGKSEQLEMQNNFAFSMNLFEGETVFRPVTWALKLEPIFNINYLSASENGVISPSPTGSLSGSKTPPPGNGFVTNPGDINTLLNGQTGPAGSYRGSGSTERVNTLVTLQQAFAEVHLKDLSDNYDFLSVRAGIQPFNGDFRGFIYNDVNNGVRLFGNLNNNLYQYNLAWFHQLEKDTDSGLNTLSDRNQDVFVANVYRQDCFFPGYTTELSFFANYDHGGTHYDDNGFVVRPAPIGEVVPHDLQAYYIGWAGDGHIGRINVSHAFYEALGRDDFNDIAGRPVNINAQMAALEVSYDHDWARFKASFFYASGDNNVNSKTATGFDAIVDNPNFTGGPFSYWTSQGFNLGGTSVNLKDENSLLPDLRTSKTEGQANFVNPGVFIYGVGAEFDVTPKVRTFLNANYIMFAETGAIESVLQTAHISQQVGCDLSLGFQYRPFLTDNVIVSAGFGVLIPGDGYRDIYKTNPDPVPGFSTGPAGSVDPFLYTGLIAITFTY